MKIFITIILALSFVALFIFLISKLKIFRSLGISRNILLVLLMLKIVASFSLFGVYSIIYEGSNRGDIFKYHNGGLVLYSAFSESPSDYFKMLSGICADEPQLHKYYDTTDYWYKKWNYGLFNDNRTIIRFAAFLDLFSLGNIYINLLLCAFVAFVGSYFLALSFVKTVPDRKWSAIIAAFIIPSVLFWSSSIMKECLVMFSLGILTYSWFELCDRFKIKHLIFFVLASVLLILAKFYVFLALVPGLILYLIPSKIGKRKLSLSVVGIFIAVMLAFVFSEKIIGLNFVEIITDKQHDFINMVNAEADAGNAGSNIDINRLEPSVWSFAGSLIPAYVNTFFRPFVTEANSFLKLFTCLENILFLLVFIYMCVRFRKIGTQEFKFVLFSLSYIIVLYGLVGLTTPNLGALVRYKIPAMPFLLMVMLTSIDFNMLKNKIAGKFPKLLKL